MGDLVQEQHEEDRRLQEEETAHIMEAEAAWVADTRTMRKTAKKAKRKARELDSEDSLP
jgi:hypothetical protein